MARGSARSCTRDRHSTQDGEYLSETSSCRMFKRDDPATTHKNDIPLCSARLAPDLTGVPSGPGSSWDSPESGGPNAVQTEQRHSQQLKIYQSRCFSSRRRPHS